LLLLYFIFLLSLLYSIKNKKSDKNATMQRNEWKKRRVGGGEKKGIICCRRAVPNRGR